MRRFPDERREHAGMMLIVVTGIGLVGRLFGWL